MVGETEICLEFPMEVQTLKCNDKKAFQRGPIVLARDEQKEGRKIDFNKTEFLERSLKDGSYQFKSVYPAGDEHYRCEIKTLNGDKMILSDYATCGKKWMGKLLYISVWMNVK